MATTKNNGADLDVLKEDLARLREDVGSLSAALLQRMKSKAEGVGEKVSERAADGRDALRDLLVELGERAEDARDSVTGQVRAHPALSLLSAFGIGFLVGKILDRG